MTAIAAWAMAQPALAAPVDDAVAVAVERVTPQVVAWRRDIHEHPELGNEEFRTAALVARHLRALGFDEVRTGVGVTGVVGALRGRLPGATVALRADMDALPIREATGLPFASRATAMFDGRKVPVMHACGHDAHVAILLGAATVLVGMRERIAGTVMFIFQPAEEGGPPGVLSGAQRMIRDGVFAGGKPDAILALHVEPGPVGRIMVRPGPMLSSATDIAIDLSGRQAHAGRPWEGTDLVNLSADIVKSLSTIASRRVDVFAFPNVVSIGALQAGVRMNVLPGTATLRGTIRTFDLARRDALKGLVTESVESLARSYGAQAQVGYADVALVTRNDPTLLDRLLPALRIAAGDAGLDVNTELRGAAEDFSFFEQDVPGLYYIIGSTPSSQQGAVFGNHSDRFDIDEAVLPVGVGAHVRTTLAFLDSSSERR